MSAPRRWLLATFTLGLAVSITLSELSLAGLALTLLLARGPRRPRFAWPLAVPLAAFAAWSIVAALASARPLGSLVSAKGLLTLGTFYVVLHALQDRQAVHRFATVLFVLMSLVSLVSVWQVLTCPLPDVATAAKGYRAWKCSRAHGFYSIYMTLAGVLTLVMVSVVPRLLGSRDGLVWRIVAWLAGVAALALTYVRGAWLGFAVGAVGCALASRRRRIALAVVGFVVVAALAALPGVLQRAERIGDPTDDTTRDRLAMLRGGLAMAREHPVTGVGPGQVKHLYGLYAPPEALRRHTSHLHNTPLQILVERGVPGLVAWLALFAAFFVEAGRILRRLPKEAATGDREIVLGSIAAIAAFLVAGLFEYNFGDTEVLLVACSLMALPFVIARDRSADAGPAALAADATPAS